MGVWVDVKRNNSPPHRSRELVRPQRCTRIPQSMLSCLALVQVLGDGVVSGRLDEAVEERGDLGASLAAASVVIFPSDNDSPEVSFHRVIMCALPR